MPRSVASIETGSALKRRLTLAGAAGAAVAAVIGWATSSAPAEQAPIDPPVKAQWAGSASPFATLSAGSPTPQASSTETAPEASATEPAAEPTPAAPAAAQAPDTRGVHVAPMRSSSGMAGARGGPEAPDTEAEN